MCEKLKIGVMGLRRGVFALNCQEALADDMVITAVCEIDDTAIENVKKKISPDTKIYKDFDEFINSGLDGVILCNYFDEHASCAIKAMEAGVAVLSETTAAPSLGECIDLVEAAERYNGRYMLGANCPYFTPVHLMKGRLESGEYGKVMYAEAEYIHSSGAATRDLSAMHGISKDIDLDNLHWRQTLPSCYYNMHTLGPLMYITNTVPKKVVGKAVCMPDININKLNDTPKTFCLTEMDSGAVFCTTGCVSAGVTSKWYRVSCTGGTMETVRDDWKLEWLLESKAADEFKKTWNSWSMAGCMTEEEEKKYGRDIDAVGHGGIDFVLMLDFIKFLKGEKEAFFDVYRSVALTAAGILTWYSILDGSKEYEIPDFKDKEAREIFRGDYRKPFAKAYKDLTLPCRLSELHIQE